MVGQQGRAHTNIDILRPENSNSPILKDLQLLPDCKSSDLQGAALCVTPTELPLKAPLNTHINNILLKPNQKNVLFNKPTLSPDIANAISEGPFSLIKANRQSHIVLEIWTNGSVHPRQALKSSLDFLTTTFMSLNNVKVLGSMYKSDITYKQILQNMD